jgi:DNA-binding NarL/FixJ family response regulator
VLMLTSFDHEQAMLRAFGAGANGFAVKQSAPETLRLAVRVVAGGGTFIDPLVAHRLVNMVIRRRQANGPHDLTPTEMEVLSYLPKGLTNRQIGNELGVAVETVKTHVGHVLRKLGASHRSEAATIALREGLL